MSTRAPWLTVYRDGVAVGRVLRARCAIGPAGVRRDKREGDGATPSGRFPVRRLLFRADRVPAPAGGLPAVPITVDDGWCDDPAHADYNRPVRLPFAGGHERLWLEGGVYDLVLVIGHNDEPVVPGAGSAVFVHVATDDYAPTAGCVALARADLLALLADIEAGDVVEIRDEHAPPPDTVDATGPD